MKPLGNHRRDFCIKKSFNFPIKWNKDWIWRGPDDEWVVEVVMVVVEPKQRNIHHCSCHDLTSHPPYLYSV